MLAAVITTFLFAIAAIFGQRLSRLLGAIPANFWRLLIATALLGCITLFFSPKSFHPDASLWFFISGIIGFGIGDVTLFLAYANIGSRLTILIVLCTAPIFGAIGEFLWLGTTISPVESACIIAILAGILLALLHQKASPSSTIRGSFIHGTIYSVIAGFGQGIGAVISKHAQKIADDADVVIPGMSQAFQRTVGGLFIGFLAYLVWKRWATKNQIGRKYEDEDEEEPPPIRNLPFWLIGAALFGPVIGVSCFQWALSSTPSAIVLAITSTTPLLLMPFAMKLEGDRPPRLAIVGSLISVAGVVVIFLHRGGVFDAAAAAPK